MKPLILLALSLSFLLFWLPHAAAQADPDGDGIWSRNDNCPTVDNQGQEDLDRDGRGDACDNCFDVFNFNQADADGDRRGNVCDPTPW